MSERVASVEQEASNPPVGGASDRSWPFRTKLGPLSLPPKRVRLWAIAIALVGLVPIDTALVNGGSDWPVFWSAGATVGTPDFLDPSRHFAWQAAHGVIEYFFPYPPAAGWFFWSFGLLPEWLGFIANAIVMLAFVGLSGLLVARIFGLRRDVGLLLALAWTPLTASVDIGQNAPLTAVLALWAIDALRRDRPIEVGLATGLMMYKPTLALPLLGLLVLRLRWRDLAVAAVVVAAGYLASAAAAAGDWGWLASWTNQLGPWLARDLVGNANKAVSIPGLLGRVPNMPDLVPWAAAAVLVALSLRGLIRAPLVEAASAACLVGLVAGPRVWGYEAGLALPIIAWAVAGGLSEPWRTRLVFLAVPLGLLWLVSPYTQVSGVAAILAAAMAMWLWRWRPAAAAPTAPDGRAPDLPTAADSPGSQSGTARRARGTPKDAR